MLQTLKGRQLPSGLKARPRDGLLDNGPNYRSKSDWGGMND